MKELVYRHKWIGVIDVLIGKCQAQVLSEIVTNTGAGRNPGPGKYFIEP